MGFVRDITGAKDQKKASREANAAAQESGQEAIEFQREALGEFREDLAPFRELGQTGIGLSSFLTDPQAQANFVRTNPLFQAALESVNEATMQNQAARGKLGSGGTLEALQGNFMSTALPFIDRQTQNINNLLTIGQNAAARTGTAGLNTAQNTGNILQGMANMQGAAGINQANIMAQSKQDLLSNFANGGFLGAASGGALVPQSNYGSQLFGGFGGGNSTIDIGGTAYDTGLSSGGGGGVMSFLNFLCDKREKENIKPLYKDVDGLTVYEFTYKADSAKRQFEGKMAQDIQKIDPEAVYQDHNGHLKVSPKYAPKLKQEAS